MSNRLNSEPTELKASRKSTKVGGRAIFRSDVLERYIQNESKTVLPRYVSPRNFVYLWAFAVLFLIAGLSIVAWPFMGPLLGN